MNHFSRKVRKCLRKFGLCNMGGQIASVVNGRKCLALETHGAQQKKPPKHVHSPPLNDSFRAFMGDECLLLQ